MTKFRAGLLTGLAAGYYLGARAGRGRYDQINQAVGRLRRTHAVGRVATAAGRAAAVLELGRFRLRDAVDTAAPATGPSGAPPDGLPRPPSGPAPPRAYSSSR